MQEFTQNETQNFSQIHAQSKTQNHIPQGLNEFFIRGENPHKIHKIYTKATKNALSPAKIDYIIFLDSDDFWEKNCLAECLKAAFGEAGKKPDMVWFDWGALFDGIAPFGFPSWQEVYGYFSCRKRK